MKAKKTATRTMAARLLALVLVCLLSLSLFAGCKSKKDEEKPVNALADKDVYTLDKLSADDARLNKTVASVGKEELTNRTLQVIYYMQFFSFMNVYGSYASQIGLDTTKPLSAQTSIDEGGLSWEQFFLREALDQFHELSAIGEKARAEAFEMPQDVGEQIQSVLKDLQQQSDNYGYDNVDGYLSDSFGEGVSLDTYKEFLNLYFYAMAYEQDHYDAIECTDAELLEYFIAHQEDYSGVSADTPNVNVRHILITPEDADGDGSSTEEEKAAAKAKAEALLAEYQENPTEENFAALANANSADPGSNTNGGLYEDVYPSQMVQPFNDWCFDGSRKNGDTGIVETSYGYHVMYFVTRTEEYYWKELAKSGFAGEIMDAWLAEILEAAPMTVDYGAIVLSPMPTSPTADK